MNLDDRLHDGLRDVEFPADLVPPARLADTVLRTARRRRRARVTVIGVAALVTVALLAPAVFTGGRSAGPAGPAGTRATPTVAHEPKQTPPDGTGPASAGGAPLAVPGGGPQVIHVYTEGERSFLLDTGSGQYLPMPFTVVLSPDLSLAAVNDNGRLGIAGRDTLALGPKAVHWLDLPPGNGPSWSPDGTALLWTSIDKDPAVRFTAHRFDVATEHVTSTPVPVPILGATVGWAADSRRYLALLAGAESADTVDPGGLRYLAPDGTAGERVDVQGGTVGGASCYSPSRRHFVADASGLMSARPLPSPVLDAVSGKAVGSVPPGVRPVGWYDDTTIVRLTPGGAALQLADMRSGAVSRSIPLTAAGQVTGLQLGSSAALTGQAAALGF